MKKLLIPSLLFLSFLFCTSNAQTDYIINCPSAELSVGKGEAFSQSGGKYKPASNLPGQYFRALVVFVQFEGDNRTDPAWSPGYLPNWADDFIDSQTASEYTDMTISDYWKEMSMGNFDFIGDVYSELVVLPPESYYIQNNKDFSDCNLDVLTEIDPYVDFSLYDNWKLESGQFVFSPGNSDKLVDMILMIYRTPAAWFGDGYGNFSGIAMLGFSPEFTTNDLNTVGQTIKINGGLGSSGSGLTIRTGLSGHYNVMGLCNHEFGHYLFGYDHINWGGIMGGSTYALSGWERERLGYVAYTTVYQDNFSITLSDYISTGDILKIPIPITNPNSPNFFLVENHQRLSHYDQITRGGSLNGGFVLETSVGAGIYITLNYHADVFEQLEVYPRVADGDFDWAYDGDFYAGPGFYVGEPWEGYVPKTRRTAINRISGKNDRMPQHIYWNNHWAAKWCDIDDDGEYWLSRDVMGDDTDPFTLTNNVLFSPWSNPSSYSSLTGGATNYSVWVYNQNGNNVSLQVKTTANSSLSLPPSKPNILWLWNGPVQYGWIHLNWNAQAFDGYPIESDYQWSELQRKIGTGSWTTVYSGPNRYWSDHSITYDPNGNIPVYFRVRVRDTQDLWSIWSDLFSTKMVNINYEDKIGVQTTSNVKPTDYSLNQNYPNPFNPTTTISYSIPRDGLVSMKVFDVLGNEVANLVNENQSAGIYHITFNAGNLPSGIYFYKLTSGNFTSTKKLILMK